MQIGKPSWMPYANQGEVAVRLGDFVNETLGPQVGLVWSDPSGSAVIRLPRFDADGYGFTLVARCTGPVMPAPTQKSSGVWQSIEDALAERAKSSPGGAGATRFYMRPGTAPADPNAVTLDQVIEAHPKLFDGIGSVLDIAGLIAGWGSAFTVFTGGMAIMPALGALAFGACLVMLAADGGAFLMELDGKRRWRKNTTTLSFSNGRRPLRRC